MGFVALGAFILGVAALFLFVALMLGAFVLLRRWTGTWIALVLTLVIGTLGYLAPSKGRIEEVLELRKLCTAKPVIGRVVRDVEAVRVEILIQPRWPTTVSSYHLGKDVYRYVEGLDERGRKMRIERGATGSCTESSPCEVDEFASRYQLELSAGAETTRLRSYVFRIVDLDNGEEIARRRRFETIGGNKFPEGVFLVPWSLWEFFLEYPEDCSSDIEKELAFVHKVLVPKDRAAAGAVDRGGTSK